MDGVESERASSVSADMAGIFAGAQAARRGKPDQRAGVAPIVRSKAPRRRSRGMAWGLAGLAGLAAAGGAIWLARPDPAPVIQPVPPFAEAPIRPLPALPRTAQATEASPVPAPAAPVIETPPVDTKPEAPPARPATRVASVAARAPSAKPAPAPSSKPASTKASAQPGGVRPEPFAQCGDLLEAEHAWCMRPRMLAADRRLRAAYAEAMRAGVDRKMLVSARREWARLRRKATSEPVEVTTAYQDLATRLEEARSSVRAGERG